MIEELKKKRVYSEESKERMRQARKLFLERGGKVWNKGKVCTYGEKISTANKGRQAWNKGKQGIYTEESLLRISEGTKKGMDNDDTRLKLSKASLGRVLTIEHKKNISLGVNKKTDDEWKDIVTKRNSTKRINNTFNTSKDEDAVYDLLLAKYKDVVRQYYSEEYPFACDFFIPENRLYIECHFSWTHGSKAFEGSVDDMIKLSTWKSKSSEFYKNAINTWTKRDIEKLNTFNSNKLNYKIFYTKTDFMVWYEQ